MEKEGEMRSVEGKKKGDKMLESKVKKEEKTKQWKEFKRKCNAKKFKQRRGEKYKKREKEKRGNQRQREDQRTTWVKEGKQKVEKHHVKSTRKL